MKNDKLEIAVFAILWTIVIYYSLYYDKPYIYHLSSIIYN